ncbi:MAG TPA: tetratricopeptide repeat protein [Hyphomicrobiales bacterium]|nr:tetratricopeptide repeat protein [Hyphomicrobiales bacterium]
MLTLALIGCQGLRDGDAQLESDRLLSLKRQAAEAYADDRYAEALPLYQELNREIPNDAQLWLRTGNTYARLNQPQDAIRCYRAALKDDPRLAKAWHNMGIIQLRQAANTFTRMVEFIDPGDPLYQRAIDMSEATLEVLNGRRGNDHAE